MEEDEASDLQKFPPDVHKWMKQNAKPKMAVKLMKVCKYFKHKNGFPFLVVKRVTNKIRDLWTSRTLNNEVCNIEDIEKKLWITGRIRCTTWRSNAISNLLAKTVVCDLRKLILKNQNITLNEFKKLTEGGNVVICNMQQTLITDKNDEIVSLEDICECLPNVRKIHFGAKLAKIVSLEAVESKMSQKMEDFTLSILFGSDEDFDLQRFLEYIKKHQQIRYKLRLCGITFDEYVQKYAPSVKKVSEEWSPECERPEIVFVKLCYHYYSADD
uniref:Uncharacterized protein n=1 Tax=Panagrolaimus sp. ES5 TaxID=591445 RepID=A0AC34F4L7_9BILA